MCEVFSIYRRMFDQLSQWKKDVSRKPLILQGIRQVGKTFLLKNFGSQAYEDTAYFNFEENPALTDFFRIDSDVERIMKGLSVIHGRAIHKGTTLIIFDEIQECNEALNALKYFRENANDYHIACAGSLLGVALSRPASFPVGKVSFLTLRPLDFNEFLEASGGDSLLEFVTGITKPDPLPEAIFNRLADRLQAYFITGGMPEPVSVWLNTTDVTAVEKVQKEILTAYELDFAKHAPVYDIPKLRLIWNSIPVQLAKENGKFIYGVLREGARARDYEDAMTWLENAGMVHKVVKIEKPGMPMAAYDNPRYFKLYAPDVGLLRVMAGLPPKAILEENPLFTEFKGVLAENFVLQELVALLGVVPRYWTSGNTAEVDFVARFGEDILPLEVKASVNVKSRSLAVYRQKYAPPVALRTSLLNLKQEEGLLNIPLFLLRQLPQLLATATRR